MVREKEREKEGEKESEKEREKEGEKESEKEGEGERVACTLWACSKHSSFSHSVSEHA